MADNTIHVEFKPVGEDPFILELELPTIQHVAGRFRESGMMNGKNVEGEVIYVLPNHLISFRRVAKPKIDLRRTKAPDPAQTDIEDAPPVVKTEDNPRAQPAAPTPAPQPDENLTPAQKRKNTMAAKKAAKAKK